MISENIARLRREANMTQEKLAQAIGISTQAVSKWENGTTMPDITLLPLIADQFGVTIDELYGKTGDQNRRINPSELPAEARRAVISCLCRVFMLENGVLPRDAVSRVTDDLESDPESQSMFCRANYGSVYACSGMAFVSTRTEEESIAALSDDGAVGYLEMLCDQDIRKILAYVLGGPDAVTAKSAAAKCGISDEKAGAALERLAGLGNLLRMEVDIGGDEKLTMYMIRERERAALIFMIFGLAARLAGYKSNYYGFIG
ncbi:MAG: helix-turn-helix domain-containing protein [Clostridiales bacterium]|nr:helix-turn-helix domain-containing protein [Clostridiales bacterium]